MVTLFLLTTPVLLALAITANPVVALVNIPVTKRVGTNNFKNLAKYNQLRVQALRANVDNTSPKPVFASPAENFQCTSYLATVGVGNPPKNFNLVIDTGSSNTWVGANKSKPYEKTETSFPTPYNVSVAYGSGNFSGIEVIDQVTLAPGLVILSQSIGVANVSEGFTDVDGILGVGPTILTNSTLSPPLNGSMLVPTVTDNLFASDTISEQVLGVFFAPLTNSSGEEFNGELTWGGIDKTKFTGEITYVPVTETSPASHFWGLNASASYGNTPLLVNVAGFTDTGNSRVQLATDAFKLYQNLTGGVLDAFSNLLAINASQYSNLKTLTFHITGTDAIFNLSPNGQIFPRVLNKIINPNATADTMFLVVGDMGTESGAGLDFTLGQAWLERFYSAYDYGNRKIGLATTHFTDATTN